MVRKKSLFYESEKAITEAEFDADDIGRYSLVIRIEKSSLVIGVFRADHCLAFELYKMDTLFDDGFEYVHAFEQLAKEHRFLSIKHWQKVIVILQDESFVIVPKMFFEEADANLYMQNNAPTSVNDHYLHFTYHINNTVSCVFSVNKVLSSLLESMYPNSSLQYAHSIAMFADALSQNGKSTANQLNVLVKNKSIAIVQIEGKNLMFANIFQLSSKDDFVYFTLLAAQKQAIEEDKLQIVLYGDIAQEAPMLAGLKRYAANIVFGEKIDDLVLYDKYFSEELNKYRFVDFFAALSLQG